MSQQEEQVQDGMYGYGSDEVKASLFNFGLNTNVHLVKFEWIPNGGKDGAEQEALEIVFSINGQEKGYRQFPITKAFDEQGNEITDPNHVKFKEAIQNLNSVVTHILHAFLDEASIKAGFNKPIRGFKDFATTAAAMLPAGFQDVPLDMFMQYQWSIRQGQSRTYLEIPKSMKSGKWLMKSVEPVGSWHENRTENPSDNDQNALTYTDDANNVHPFRRYGKYMKSKSANQQVDATAAANEGNTTGAAGIAQATSLPAAGSPGAASAAAGW